MSSIAKAVHKIVPAMNEVASNPIGIPCGRKDVPAEVAPDVMALSPRSTTSSKLDFTQLVQSATTNKWQSDADVNSCCACATTFSLFNRKHHCRVCGLIFCHDCSNFYATVPDLGFRYPVRVCGGCFMYRCIKDKKKKKSHNLPTASSCHRSSAISIGELSEDCGGSSYRESFSELPLGSSVPDPNSLLFNSPRYVGLPDRSPTTARKSLGGIQRSPLQTLEGNNVAGPDSTLGRKEVEKGDAVETPRKLAFGGELPSLQLPGKDLSSLFVAPSSARFQHRPSGAGIGGGMEIPARPPQIGGSMPSRAASKPPKTLSHKSGVEELTPAPTPEFVLFSSLPSEALGKPSIEHSSAPTKVPEVTAITITVPSSISIPPEATGEAAQRERVEVATREGQARETLNHQQLEEFYAIRETHMQTLLKMCQRGMATPTSRCQKNPRSWLNPLRWTSTATSLVPTTPFQLIPTYMSVLLGSSQLRRRLHASARALPTLPNTPLEVASVMVNIAAHPSIAFKAMLKVAFPSIDYPIL
jgi:hypothetical protein